MAVRPPEPELGNIRFIVRLPAAACAELAFEGAGRELGNGWFDLSARLALALAATRRLNLWRDLSFDIAVDITARSRKGGNVPDQVLCDRAAFVGQRTGALVRDSRTAGDTAPCYWLYAGGRWWDVQAIELDPAKRADDSGPPGTIAADLKIDHAA